MKKYLYFQIKTMCLYVFLFTNNITEKYKSKVAGKQIWGYERLTYDSILIQKMNSLIIVSGITGFISACKQRWHTMSYHIINPDGSIKSVCVCVCVCLVANPCLTFCDPMETAACQASLSFTVSQSLLKLMSTVCTYLHKTYMKNFTSFLYPLALWNFL